MRLLLLFILFVLPSFQTISSADIVLTELPGGHRLPKNEIKCIFQDSEGYMWYGTDGGGICRDDGYNIQVFRSDLYTPGLMENNSITCITEDCRQRIWFGTKRGAYVLDKGDYEITPIEDEGVKSWVIPVIEGTKDGTVWIAAGNNLYRYNEEFERVGNYLVEWENEPATVYRLYEDKKGDVWQLQWQGGLLKFDVERECFVPVEWPFKVWPTSIVEDHTSSCYWVGTWGSGIVKFDPEGNPGDPFSIQPGTIGEGDNRKSEVIRIVQDKVMNYIWAATMENLYAYEITDTGSLQTVKMPLVLPEGKAILNDLVIDDKSNIWAGSYYPGTFIVSFGDQSIERDPVNVLAERLKYPSAPLFLAYEDGSYWLWQNRSGLYLYRKWSNDLLVSRETGLLAYFARSEREGGVFMVKSDSIVILFKQKEAEMIGAEICRIPLKDYEKIRTLHEDSSGNLWIGTTFDLWRYDPETGKLTVEWESTGIVNKIASSVVGDIYVATEPGTFLVLEKSGGKRSFRAEGNLMNMAVSPKEGVYIGTLQGEIYCFDGRTVNLTQQSERMGLTGDAIMDLATDGMGNLWIITDQRIRVYDFNNNSYRVITASDLSLQGFLSVDRDREGKIHVGGTGGIVVFPADYSVHYPENGSTLYLSALSINGSLPEVVGCNGHLITLQPDETDLDLFFSVLDPVNTGRVSYAFRYSGRDNWNYLPEGENRVSLLRVARGRHILEVKATDKNGIWQQKYITVLIDRLPYWYQNALTWFFSFLILSIVISVICLRRNARCRKEQQEFQPEQSGEIQPLPVDPEGLAAYSDNKLIRQIMELMDEKMNDPDYSIEQLSKDLGMSRANLHRKVKSITGVTPTDLVKSVRLKRAAELLKQGELNVNEIAWSVGFSSASYFTQSFKKEFGVLPNRYK